MANISTVELNITTNRPQDRATLAVSCDVEFTEFEVNAMNMLGLRHRLQCKLQDMAMLYPDTVLLFEQQRFPHAPGGAKRYEHAVFETVAAMSDLHLYVFGKDTLLAEVTLTNEETGSEHHERSKTIAVDLAAY